MLRRVVYSPAVHPIVVDHAGQQCADSSATTTRFTGGLYPGL